MLVAHRVFSSPPTTPCTTKLSPHPKPFHLEPPCPHLPASFMMIFLATAQHAFQLFFAFPIPRRPLFPLERLFLAIPNPASLHFSIHDFGIAFFIFPLMVWLARMAVNRSLQRV
jgi:hypothetical protein